MYDMDSVNAINISRISSHNSNNIAIIPPLRFGRVNPSLLRGAYPTLRNFTYLRRLKLRTIVSLTPEPPTEDLIDFAKLEGISIHHIQVGH